MHLCLRKADQKLVIIKQIPVDQMTKEERQAAQNECQVLKLLNHPNVIEYYENFLEDKALMIAMEYAPGRPTSSQRLGCERPSPLWVDRVQWCLSPGWAWLMNQRFRVPTQLCNPGRFMPSLVSGYRVLFQKMGLQQ